MRPIRTFRPVSVEPQDGCVVASDCDVRPGTNSAELFAVLEDTAAHSLFFDLRGAAVSFSYFDEVFDVQHASIIGNLTAHVNGFFTARLNPSYR
ncbi:hypothetical protein AGRA671_10335 [Agrobacterium radiobacter]|nr:Uncharacterised protein [Agrobacterium tumefaciens]